MNSLSCYSYLYFALLLLESLKAAKSVPLIAANLNRHSVLVLNACVRSFDEVLLAGDSATSAPGHILSVHVIDTSIASKERVIIHLTRI